jgi:hypothetical protein
LLHGENRVCAFQEAHEGFSLGSRVVRALQADGGYTLK